MRDKLITRIIIATVGLVFCGIGVGIFLYSNLGVDPASVFQLGMAKVFGISYGMSSALMNIVILATVFFIQRSYISISSFLAIFSIGFTADFINSILKNILTNELPLAVKLVMIFIGLMIMGLGIAVYIQANLGVGAVDLVSEIISDRTKFPYRWVRIAGDCTFVVIGYFLGGTVGIGTVVAAFMTGPVVQLVRPFVAKVTGKFLIENS